MEGSSGGSYREAAGGTNNHGGGSALSASNSSFKNGVGNSVHGGGGGGGEWGVPTFQHQPSISMEWTNEEQSILEDGLAQYARESNIIRYAKIAVLLKTKTVRDVALRCRWMTRKEISKRRKEDLNARKGKERKELVIDSSGKNNRLAIQSGLSHAPALIPNGKDDIISYNDINSTTRQLLQQNAWTFNQISENLATHQAHENISLLSKARDNILQILANLNEIAPTMKKMPALPKLSEDLANSILPPSNFPIQL